MNSNELNKIVILYCDDWSVLYVNGEEKIQGHDIDVWDIAKFCPIGSMKSAWAGITLENMVIESGKFPKLEEILFIQPSLSDLFE